eukprot:gene24575-10186_t
MHEIYSRGIVAVDEWRPLIPETLPVGPRDQLLQVIDALQKQLQFNRAMVASVSGGSEVLESTVDQSLDLKEDDKNQITISPPTPDSVAEVLGVQEQRKVGFYSRVIGSLVLGSKYLFSFGASSEGDAMGISQTGRREASDLRAASDSTLGGRSSGKGDQSSGPSPAGSHNNSSARSDSRSSSKLNNRSSPRSAAQAAADAAGLDALNGDTSDFPDFISSWSTPVKAPPAPQAQPPPNGLQPLPNSSATDSSATSSSATSPALPPSAGAPGSTITTQVNVATPSIQSARAGSTSVNNSGEVQDSSRGSSGSVTSSGDDVARGVRPLGGRVDADAGIPVTTSYSSFPEAASLERVQSGSLGAPDGKAISLQGAQPGSSGTASGEAPGGQSGLQSGGLGAPGGQSGLQSGGLGAPGGQSGLQSGCLGAPGGQSGLQSGGLGTPGGQSGLQSGGLGAPGGQSGSLGAPDGPGAQSDALGAPAAPGGQSGGLSAPGDESAIGVPGESVEAEGSYEEVITVEGNKEHRRKPKKGKRRSADGKEGEDVEHTSIELLFDSWEEMVSNAASRNGDGSVKYSSTSNCYIPMTVECYILISYRLFSYNIFSYIPVTSE